VRYQSAEIVQTSESNTDSQVTTPSDTFPRGSRSVLPKSIFDK